MVELATGNVGIKPGWVRLNLNYFVPESEIKFIIKAIDWIATNGHYLLKDYLFDDKTALWKNKTLTEAQLHSLKSFNLLDEGVATVATHNREQEQMHYFDMADKIVSHAKMSWPVTPCQNYHYNQVENPLRWYTLAQDVTI